MAHQTFVSIRYRSADSEFRLFLKEDRSLLRFFTSKNIAINGSFQYEDIRRDFCKKFEIEPAQFAGFYVQELDIDLSDIFEQGSNSIAELHVDKTFFQETKNRPEQFEWIKTDELEIFKSRFRDSHAQILIRLQYEDKLSDLPADLLEGIRVLKKAQSQHRLVIFAGAGISKDSGIPLWNDIKQDMLDVLGPEISKDTDSTLVAQYLFKARGKNEYNEKIRELLGYYRNPEPNDIHNAIINLRPRHIITTNFDNLLEKALASQSFDVPFALIRCDQDFPYASFDRFLVKMHGDWDLMNFIFKEDDYLSYSRQLPLIEGFVRGVFASHVVLFVGFSFEDRNLKQILGWVKDILGNDLQPAYLFMTDEKNKHERAYFESKGLHLLYWPDEISDSLLKIGQKPTIGHSWRGAKTADFLKFLTDEQFYKYENLRKARRQSILSQMYDALWAFRAFNSLPPYFYERLFPFSPFRLSASRKQADARTGPGHLNVRNESIIQLAESIEFINNRIEVKRDGPISEEIVATDGYQNKLWYVFEKLISSGITCVHRDGDEKHHKINIHNPFSERLLFPKWAELRLDELLEAIEKREYAFGQPGWIPNPLRDGLLDGYILFKMHFFDIAYDVFLKIEEEAKRSEDFALYFLSRRNRERTSREIYWRAMTGRYSKGIADQMKNESEKMDLFETLRAIKVEKPVRQLLRDIQEETIIKRYTHEIEENLAKILETFKQFQNSHSMHSGPDYAGQLEWAFDDMCAFFDSNGLILKDDLLFESGAEKTFEGLVASHRTAEPYENRYKDFHCLSILNCLLWIQPKSLRSILKKYGLKQFDFANAHKKVLVNRAINFFKSGYNDNTLFGNTFENILYQNYLKANALYSIVEKKLFPNLLIVLARVDLDDVPELANRLCDSILKSYQYIPNYLLNSDVFMPFFLRHLKFFDIGQIEVLLDLLIQKRQLRSYYAGELAIQLKETHPDFRIFNEVLFEKLIGFKQGKHETERLSVLIELYGFLDEPLQSQLNEAIQENLKSIVNLEGVHLYLDARLKGCLNNKPFTKEVLGALKGSFDKLNQIQFTDKGEIEPIANNSIWGGKEWLDNYAWLVSKISQVQFIQGLDRITLNWFLRQPDLPAFLKWLLSPKSFDYTQFDHFWLFFILKEKEILTKLAALKVPELNDALQKGLSNRYSEKLANIYFKYFSA